MKKLITGCLVLALSGATGIGTGSAQSITKGLKKVGDATTDTVKKAGKTVKHVGEETAETTKKGANKVKKTVTGETHFMCADGTRLTVKTNADAKAGCARHGGVAKR